MKRISNSYQKLNEKLSMENFSDYQKLRRKDPIRDLGENCDRGLI